MIQLQVINKILEDKDFSIIESNLIDKSYFTDYEDEFNYLKEHYDKYGNVPDKETFLSRFDDFSIINVNETNEYLLNKLREDKLYNNFLPTLQNVSDLVENGDTIKAIDTLRSSLSSLPTSTKLGGTSIIKNAEDRYKNYLDRINNQDKYYFKSGFDELDTITHGLQRGEELVILFARVNNGKSFVAEKMAVAVWEQGYNVGFISPEMTAGSVGYRFDTLYQHFSNKNLMWGNKLDDEQKYKDYLTQLSQSKADIMVGTPLDFDNNITVSKIRQWVLQNNLDMVVIDGMSYLKDERGKGRDNKTTSLTNISEDLMTLSVELSIPIIAVVQANRNGVEREEDSGTPEMDTIRDSDGMAMNASKVLSIRQKDGVLEIGIKKQRNGAVGGKLTYLWNIDKGVFTWLPSNDDAVSSEITEKQTEENKNKFDDLGEVF